MFRRVLALVGLAALFLSLPAFAQDDDLFSDMVFPQDVEATEYVDSWGSLRSGGRSHEGTDLMAEKMTPVFAVDDGVVTIQQTHALAGRYLVIEHEGGWESWYVHLNNDNEGTDDGSAPMDLTYAEAVEIGATVKRGELVGWVGDSGNAEGSGSHTHFELHIDGVSVNPYPYLRRAEAAETALTVMDEVLPAFVITGEPADPGVNTEIQGVTE